MTLKSAIVNGIAVVIKKYSDCYQVESYDESGARCDLAFCADEQKALAKFDSICEQIIADFGGQS